MTFWDAVQLAIFLGAFFGVVVLVNLVILRAQSPGDMEAIARVLEQRHYRLMSVTRRFPRLSDRPPGSSAFWALTHRHRMSRVYVIVASAPDGTRMSLHVAMSVWRQHAPIVLAEQRVSDGGERTNSARNRWP